MKLRRRLLLLVALTIMLATAIEFGLMTASPTESVAHDGTIINEN